MTAENALPPLEWNPPEPRELPGLREQLMDQMRNPAEHMLLTFALQTGQGTVNPYPADPGRGADDLLDDEHRRLSAATLYSVSPDMSVLAVQAGEKMPLDWQLRREDVPTAAGFMVFGEPIGAYVNDDAGRNATVSIVAASWGPTRFSEHADDNLWITFWSITDYEAHAEMFRIHQGMRYDEARAAARAHRADLSWDNEVVLAFDASEYVLYGNWPESVQVDVRNTNMATETTVPWVNTVRAAWLLMKSPKTAEVTDDPLSRTMRRRAQRLNLNTSPVRVVHLHRSRRRASSTTSSEGHAHTVQYPVTGHWRQQPYPSRETVERIWIDEHIRGPEDAPFKVGKRYTVRVLDRPPRP